MINAKAMRCACIFKSEYLLYSNVEISKISKKSQIVNILDLAGHTASTATFLPCHHSVKAAIEYLNEQVWLCVTLLQTQEVGQMQFAYPDVSYLKSL